MVLPSSTVPEYQGPLNGITVVAVEQAVAAPLCTARLADAGARVIKVERAGGDFARAYDAAAGADSSYFAWINHGKESIVLDIKDDDDRALLLRMVASADVFVQNLAPGALSRLGLGADVLRQRWPRLITCDISGYGDDPALADKKAYDLLIQAESGIIAISGGPNEMGRIGISLCDIGAGVTAYAAILEALIQRSITGVGTALSVSLFDVAAEWMTVPLVQHLYGAGGPTRVGLRHPTIAPYGAYATAEGDLTLISIQNEREWHRLCSEVLDRPGLATDERFSSNNRRVANRHALEAEIGAVVVTMSRREFTKRLEAASVAYGSVNDLADVTRHPALRRRTITSSDGRRFEFPAHPVQREHRSARTSVPAIGLNSESLRIEFAGRRWSD